MCDSGVHGNEFGEFGFEEFKELRYVMCVMREEVCASL